MNLTQLFTLVKKSLLPTSLLLLLPLTNLAASTQADSNKPYSPDAYSLGATLSPSNAYRFAKGETVTSNTGQTAKINQPLDFILLSDHAEFLGVFPMLDKKDPLFY